MSAASWHEDEDGKVVLLRNSIYQAIRHSILTGELQPGQELREQVLAERYGVSRSPVRDSLLRLEQENLVTVFPRQGYLVNPISISNVEDIINLRSLIEPSCAAAAARADDAALQIEISTKRDTSSIMSPSIARSLTYRATSAWRVLLWTLFSNSSAWCGSY